MGEVIEFNQLINRARMWLAGVGFHGRRDLYELFGWKRRIDYRDFTSLYYRFGVAKRVVDIPVAATWADPPQVGADNQDFNDAWKQIVETQALWHNIMRLDKLAGLGRFAGMVVGFDDGRALDSPVAAPRQGANRSRQVIYLQPYHESAIFISAWDQDQNSPRYGKPTMYTINPARAMSDRIMGLVGVDAAVGKARQPFKCHWSRMIIIAENLLEDGTFGAARLEALYNDLNDLMKLSGSSAEMFWLVANRGMQVNVDKEMDLSREDAEDLQREVEDYQHDMRRFIRTRGVEIKDLGSHHPQPEQASKLAFQMIAAGSGIPQQILAGSSAGQIASNQDRANLADRIAERVAEYAQPIILKRTLDCFIAAGALPQPQNMQISWPEAFKMNPLERAQTSAQMARSAANLMKSHVAATTATGPNGESLGVQPLFTPEESRRIVGFGKHPPVFEGPLDSPDASGTLAPLGSDPVADVTPKP